MRVRPTRWRAGRDVKWPPLPAGGGAAPTTAAQWDERDLPGPAVRSVLAAVEESAAFGPRRLAEAERLRWTEPHELTVLGDGADWLWKLADRRFPGTRGVLDVYHAREHHAAAAKAVFGDGALAAEWGARGRLRLPEDGYWGVTDWVGQVAGAIPVGGDGAALGGLLNYFAGHQERLGYAVRLRRGQAVGSGLVEGSIKQLLNKRVKQTGARWKTEHVGTLVELGALASGPEWPEFWSRN